MNTMNGGWPISVSSSSPPPPPSSAAAAAAAAKFDLGHRGVTEQTGASDRRQNGKAASRLRMRRFIDQSVGDVASLISTLRQMSECEAVIWLKKCSRLFKFLINIIINSRRRSCY